MKVFWDRCLMILGIAFLIFTIFVGGCQLMGDLGIWAYLFPYKP